MTGAIAPDHRPVLPSTHVRVPGYWTAMASYLKASAPPGNLLVLPEDDYYQMPYTWGYYGADTFITDLIARHVVDAVSQGYAPSQQELTVRSASSSRACSPMTGRPCNGRSRLSERPCCWYAGTSMPPFPGGISHRQRRSPGATRRQGNETCPSGRKARAIRASRAPIRRVRSRLTLRSTPPCRICATWRCFPSGTALISSPIRRPFPRCCRFRRFEMAARRGKLRDFRRRAARPPVPRRVAVSHRRGQATRCLLLRPRRHRKRRAGRPEPVASRAPGPSGPTHRASPPSQRPGSRRAQL